MNAPVQLGVDMRAPAKVNLALHVTGRRADGYHELDTLAVFTEFGDRVHVAPAEEDSFSVTGPYGDAIPAGPDNLVVKARDRLRERHREAAGPVAITLEKNLPVASGIGGGSSDAAAALKALAGVWALDADGDLPALALELGADVPMCLAAQPLVARGIGEDIVPLAGMASLPLVLVNPMVAVATPAVFRGLECRDNPPLPPLSASCDLATVAEAARYLATTRNDLETAAMRIAPQIGDTLARLRETGAILSRMSGSGATCFGLFETSQAAADAADRIRAKQPGWFVVATTTGAS